MDEWIASGLELSRATSVVRAVLDDSNKPLDVRRAALIKYLKYMLVGIERYKNDSAYVTRSARYMTSLVATDYILQADMYAPEIAYLTPSAYLEGNVESYENPEGFASDLDTLINAISSL